MNSQLFPIKQPVIVLVGPTAIGKTALSLELADSFGCEIVSLDSMQVYRYMDIGTAKATEEERRQVPHHLIDIVDPDQHYDASRYAEDAFETIQAIHSRGLVPLITGGTGLYLRALLEGLFEGEVQNSQLRAELHDRLERQGNIHLHEELKQVDFQSAAKIHPNDTHRVIRALEIYYSTGQPWTKHIQEQHQEQVTSRFTNILLLGLTCERETLYSRINYRTSSMLEAGLKEEVTALLDRGYERELKPMQAIGYRHMISHLLDNVPMLETERLLARDTRRYAKRQYTWFRKMDIEWHPVADRNRVVERIKCFLSP